MDSTVGDEAFERQPPDFTADRLEARHHHGVGRVVDDDVDARRCLERTDVAALAADDAAFHLVGR